MRLCEYGCGNEAKFSPIKGRPKWCCEDFVCKCPAIREKNSNGLKGRICYWKGKTGPNTGNKHSKEAKDKMSESRKKLLNDIDNFVKISKRTIEKIKENYPNFYKIEEIKYNEEYNMLTHCKNSKCNFSKNKNGWFKPNERKIESRIWALDNIKGNKKCYLFCSDECKIEYKYEHNKNYNDYKKLVRLYTERNVKKYYNIIENIQLRGK